MRGWAQRIGQRRLMLVGLTAILIGYFAVWLPNQNAGLALIGLDISEWIKFLPQVREGMLPNRDYFYLPPITLALIIILLTSRGDNWGWRVWGARGLAVAISLLIMPFLEIIRDEPGPEWRPRLALIGLVIVAAVGAPVLGRLPWTAVRWLIIAMAAAGASLPLWAFLSVRPVVSALVGMPLGIGYGVWLNVLGHAAVMVAAAARWQKQHEAALNPG